MTINDQLDLDGIEGRVTEPEGEQQPRCGRTRSVNGDDFPPCALHAGHQTAYCQPADGWTCFIAAADQPAAARSAAV